MTTIAITLSVISALAAFGLDPYLILFNETTAFWLIGGSAWMMWGSAVTWPQWLTQITLILARATLFIFLFHWPLSIAAHIVLGTQNRWLEFLAGSIASVMLWVVWESFVRAWRSDAASHSYAQVSAAKGPWQGKVSF
jgi:hypothetical protein